MSNMNQTNYLHVGRTVACGHCEPDKYGAGLKQAEQMGITECKCVCHDSPKSDQSGWENNSSDACCKKCEDWDNDSGRTCANSDCSCHLSKSSDQPEWEKEWDKRTMGLSWSKDTSAETITLVIGNLNGAKSFIRQLLLSQSNALKEELRKKVEGMKIPNHVIFDSTGGCFDCAKNATLSEVLHLLED